MAGQSPVFKKSRRAGKSASFHIILKYGGAIRFLKNIKEDREIHILSPYFNYGRVIRKKQDSTSLKKSRMAGQSRSTHKISMMAGHSAVIYKISRMTGQSRSTRKISMIAGNPHSPIKYHMQGNLHFVHNISTMAGQTAFSKNLMEGQSAFIKKIPVYQ